MTNLPQRAIEAAIDLAEERTGRMANRDLFTEILEAAAPFIAAQERERLREKLLSDEARRANHKAAAREIKSAATFRSEEQWAIYEATISAALDSLAPEPVEEARCPGCGSQIGRHHGPGCSVAPSTTIGPNVVTRLVNEDDCQVSEHVGEGDWPEQWISRHPKVSFMTTCDSREEAERIGTEVRRYAPAPTGGEQDG